jgi:hypothetical protein
MNQIMPVGTGVVIALGEGVRPDQLQYIREAWREHFPDVPVFVVGPAEIVLREDRSILFEFTGTNLTPTFVAEFQRWWEGVNHG